VTLVAQHPIWREVLACYEALRRVGFTPDDLFLSRSPDGRMGMLVQSANYLLVANPPAADPFVFKTRTVDELEQEWTKLGALWNAASQGEMAEIWESSSICHQGMALLMDLQRRGIMPPVAAEA
jgi:hypothetical protein